MKYLLSPLFIITLIFLNISFGFADSKGNKFQFMYPDSTYVEVEDNTPLLKLYKKNFIHNTLDNGVEYYLVQNNTPTNTLSIQFIVKATRTLEEEHELGLSHLLQQLMTTSNNKQSNQEIKDFISSVTYQGFVNDNGTNFIFTVPIGDKEKIRKTIEFISYIGSEPNFNKIIVDNEKYKITSESEKYKDNEGYKIQKEIFLGLYYNSPYGKIIFPDFDQLLKDTSEENLKSFYDKWYRPHFQKIFVVGDIDVQYVEKTIKDYFSPLKNPSSNKPEEKDIPIPHHEEPNVLVFKNKLFGNDTGFQFNSKIRSKKLKTFKDYIENIHLFGVSQMTKNRMSNMSTPDGLFKSVLGGTINPMQGGKMLYLQTVISLKEQSQLKEALTQYRTELEKIRQYGFTSDEYDGILNDLQQRVEQRITRQKNIENRFLLNSLISLEFAGFSPLFPNSEHHLFNNYYKKEISVDDINEYVREKMNQLSHVVFVFGNENALLPSKEEVAKMVKEPLADVPEYVDSVMVKPFIKDFVKFGSAVSEKKHKNDITEVLLSNGAKVIFKPTPYPPIDRSKIVNANEPREKIFISGVSPGGNSTYDDLKDIASCVLIPQVIAGSGLGEFTVEELGRKLKNSNIYIQAVIGETEESIVANTKIGDAETMFKLIHLYFTAPKAFKPVWDNTITQAKNLIDQRNFFDNTAKFRNKINSVMTLDNPKTRPIPKELYDELSVERALKLFKERFNNASDFVFYVSGDFKLEAIKNMAIRYLSALPGTGEKEESVQPKSDYPKGYKLHKMKTPDLKNSLVLHVYTAPLEYNFENLSKVNAAVSILSKRLEYRFDAVEKLHGLKPSVSYDFFEEPNNYVKVSISYSITPTIAEKTMDSVKDEINNLKSFADPAELEYFQQNFEQSIVVSPTNAVQWMSRLQFLWKHNIPFDDLEKYYKLDENVVNLESIKETLNLLLGKNLQEFLLEDDPDKDFDTEAKKNFSGEQK